MEDEEVAGSSIARSMISGRYNLWMLWQLQRCVSWAERLGYHNVTASVTSRSRYVGFLPDIVSCGTGVRGPKGSPARSDSVPRTPGPHWSISDLTGALKLDGRQDCHSHGTLRVVGPAAEGERLLNGGSLMPT